VLDTGEAKQVQPELLIGVPLFNGRATVLKAVGSALAQVGVSHRVLISDNGSTDEGAAMIERAFEGAPNLQVVRHSTNRGATWNFNWLLSHASTRYFMWLASDDWLDDKYALRCIQRLEAAPDATLAFGRVEMHRFPGEDPFVAYSAKRQFKGSASQRFNMVYRHFPDVYMYGVMRSKMAQDAGGLPSLPAPDVAFIRRLSLAGPFVNVPEATFHYCAGGQWKSMDRIIADEGTNQSPKDVRPWRGQRSLRVMIDAINAINEIPMNPLARVTMLSGVVVAETERVLKRILVDALGHVLPRSSRAKVAPWIYMRWLTKEAPEILDPAVHLQREVMPSLRWSR
jgi:glycosyltransferase involved in cell wall biosynthesis